jgi:hypothetical protein
LNSETESFHGREADYSHARSGPLTVVLDSVENEGLAMDVCMVGLFDMGSSRVERKVEIAALKRCASKLYTIAS